MNKMNAKKLGITVMLIGALTVGAVAANAQQGGNPGGGQPGQPGMGFQGGDGGRGGQPGMGFQGGERGGRDGRGQMGGRFGEHEIYLMQAVMDATGLNLIDIAAQLRDGTTLGEIVTANGGTIEAVVADAVANATTAINEAVANGRLTQEQADEMIARLETAYTNILTNSAREQAALRLMDGGIVRLAAELTGLNAREIAQQLRDGASLATILTDNGVDVATFTAEATERAQARINVQVADGRITAEQGAELLAQFTEELNALLNGSAEIAPEATPAT